MGETTPTPWAKVRAAMLGVVGLVHGVRAAPLPHVVRPSELKDPVAQEEVARWTERLGSLGYVISEQELGEKVVWITGIIGGAHQASTAPFRPLFKWTGTNQGWALFANPDTHPSRLRVDGLTDQGRVVLYLADDPEHAWLAPSSTVGCGPCMTPRGPAGGPRAATGASSTGCGRARRWTTPS